jgi:beta-xylosidase
MNFACHPAIYAIATLSFACDHLRGNPLMEGADPHLEVIDDVAWMYPTKPRGGRNFFAFSSRDLKNWTEHGPILDFRDIPWIREDGRDRHGPWAPAMATRDGKFYFYYSVGPQTRQHPSRIGVAVADSPAGPFRDSGKPLLTGGNGFEAIDAMVFADPLTENYYFYAGGSDGSTLRVFEMNDDMISFRREVEVQTPPRFTEAPFIHHHAGRYHFTYSHGSYRNSSYSVHYATSESPTGPWQYRGALLESDARHKGPGHHSILRFPDNEGEWFIIYHRWNNREGDGPYSGVREIAIERIRHDEEGYLLPVQMTDAVIEIAINDSAPAAQ